MTDGTLCHSRIGAVCIGAVGMDSETYWPARGADSHFSLRVVLDRLRADHSRAVEN